MGNGFVWIVSVFGGTCLFDSGDITLFPRQNFPFGTLKLSQLTQTESSIAILKISHHTTNLTSTYPNMELVVVIDQQRQTNRKPSRQHCNSHNCDCSFAFTFTPIADTEHWLGSAESECDCVYGQELCKKRYFESTKRKWTHIILYTKGVVFV